VQGWTEPTLSQLATNLMNGSAALGRVIQNDEHGNVIKTIGQLIVDALGDRVGLYLDSTHTLPYPYSVGWLACSE
jgi:hypothetical protein